MKDQNLRRGAEGFEAFFLAQYGERWEPLRRALKEPKKKVKLKSPFSSEDEPCYEVDEASFLMMNCVPPLRGTSLDMCAAPGGKSLAALFRNSEFDQFVLNEISPDRKRRLASVVRDFVPQSVRDKIFLSGRDGAQFGLKQKGMFDWILIDAPCSGERYLLQTKGGLDEWSKKGAVQLSRRQFSLLSSALNAAKSGACLIYSTCSINCLQNEDLVEEFLERRSKEVEIDSGFAIELPNETELEKIESARLGFRIFPDRAQTGPIYFAVFKKK